MAEFSLFCQSYRCGSASLLLFSFAQRLVADPSSSASLPARVE